jgi:ATP-binding cassette subfamily B protein
MPTVRGEIRFEQVSFHYVAGVDVLQDINLHITPGETVALVGATGAGKSTLATLLHRFADVTEGRITIDGFDIRQVQRHSLVRQMSMVLQEPYLFSGTINENIRYAHTEASDADVVAAAEAVGAHDFIMALKHGYETTLAERGVNLSVGQRQLLSFARAIVGNPRILILDEATANIDTHTEILIQNALKSLLEGRTSIVIAHRLSTIRNADIIVVLEHGRVVEIGKHAELLERKGVYARLYALNYGLSQLDEAMPEDHGLAVETPAADN